MKWKKPKLHLNLKTPTKHKPISPAKWIKLRTDTLNKANGFCDYCGGSYDRLICSVYHYPKTSACCNLCFDIQHLTIKNSFQFNLLRTKMTQCDIVKNFVDLYKKNKKISIKEIDPDVTVVPLSLTEYLKSPFKTDLKIFPNEYYDTGYLDKENVINMIIDEDDDEILSDSDKMVEDMNSQDSISFYLGLQKNDPCEGIKETKLKKEEIKYLKDVFYPVKYSLKEQIKKVIKQTSKIDIDVQKTDMNYYIVKKGLASFL